MTAGFYQIRGGGGREINVREERSIPELQVRGWRLHLANAPRSSIIGGKHADHTKGFNALEIITQQMTLKELERIAEHIFGNMVKAFLAKGIGR